MKKYIVLTLSLAAFIKETHASSRSKFVNLLRQTRKEHKTVLSKVNQCTNSIDRVAQAGHTLQHTLDQITYELDQVVRNCAQSYRAELISQLPQQPASHGPLGALKAVFARALQERKIDNEVRKFVEKF